MHMMKKMKLYILVPTLFFVSVAESFAHNERTDLLTEYSYAANDDKATSLPYSTLQQATRIEYSSDNGSIPPPGRYYFIIKVTKNKIRLTIYKDYEERAAFDKSAHLAQQQYQQFLRNLIRHDIRKIKYTDPGVGGGSSTLKIYNGSSKLFEGTEDVDMHVGKGMLLNSFLIALPNSMAKEVKKLILGK